MKRLLAAAFFLAIAASAFAQTFDPAATELPPKFTGDDFEKVFQQYAKPDAPAGLYAFPLEPVFNPIYNDPAETFEVMFWLQMPELDGRNPLRNPGFRLAQKELKSSTYEATNAFGVKATVNRREVKEQYLLSRLQAEMGIALPIKVVVPRDKMAAVKDNLRFLLIAGLDAKSGFPAATAIPPAFAGATGWRITTPTLSAPVDVSAYEYTLAGDVYGIWAYDFATGRILGKYDPSGKPVAETTKLPRREYSPNLQYEYYQKVKPGMTQEDVKAIFGDEPLTILKGEYAGEKVEFWSYEGLKLAVIFSPKTKKVITTRLH